MLPIEVLFQRPRRVAMSALNLQRVAEGFVQNGLDVGREARLAHAAVLLASERSTLAQEAFQSSSAVLGITESRLKAGDISDLDLNLARNQARLAKAEILQLSAGIDVHEMGRSGSEAGPGVTVALLFLNRKEGGRARAQAELDRAARDYAAVRHRIVSEVREAQARFLRARDALDSWRGSIVPSLGKAFRKTELAYTEGEVSYLAVLEANRRLVTARLQEVVVARDLRSARVELDRSVGRNRLELMYKPNQQGEVPESW